MASICLFTYLHRGEGFFTEVGWYNKCRQTKGYWSHWGSKYILIDIKGGCDRRTPGHHRLFGHLRCRGFCCAGSQSITDIHARQDSSGRVISPLQRLLTAHNSHQRHIHAPAGFKPAIPVSGRPQTRALTHWGRLTQICVFTLQVCKTDDANLRF